MPADTGRARRGTTTKHEAAILRIYNIDSSLHAASKGKRGKKAGASVASVNKSAYVRRECVRARGCARPQVSARPVGVTTDDGVDSSKMAMW